MAVAVPFDTKDVIRRVQKALFAVKASYDASPTPENRAALTEMEELVEDLMDLDDVAEARAEAERDGYIPWDKVKAELGL